MSIDASGPNAEQIEFWNGDAGSSWARNQEVLDEMIEPLGLRAIEAAGVHRGDRVLDVGCGCGASTFAISALGAEVTGVDVSEPMLSVARQRIEVDGPQPGFQLADAGTCDFSSDYSLIFSRFGVMFFLDPYAGFANLRSALQEHGRLCFICWRSPVENPWITVPMSALGSFLPPSEPGDPRAPGPFAFANQTHVEEILQQAGFSNVCMQPLDQKLTIGDAGSVDAALDFYTHVGPLASLFASIQEEDRDKAKAAVSEAIEPYVTTQGLQLGSACWLVTADG